ncbi:MAG: AraC family transcriptional regulator [Roseiarcus sp.]
MTRRMFAASVRPQGDGRDFYVEIIANFFDFVFENIFPSGGVLKKPDGAGLDAYSLFVPLDGAVELRAGSKWVRSTAGMAGFGESPALSEQVISAGSRFLVIAVERADMTRHLSDLIERPVTRPLDFAPSVDLTTDAGLTIKAMAGSLEAGLTGRAPLLRSPIALQRMKETVIALLLEGVPHRFSDVIHGPVTAVSPHYVKRAIEFMWANASRPISTAEIAAECGVGPRALNSGFRRFKAMSMMAYLREIRLSAVRRELRDPGAVASIATIAQKWGFSHFGRFSSEYEKRFGELPSQTRRRTVGAGPGGP